MNDADERALIRSLIDCATLGVAMPDGWRLSYRSLDQGKYSVQFDRPFQDGSTGPTNICADYERYDVEGVVVFNILSYTALYG